MSWNYRASKERIEQHLASLENISVERLVRAADLENLLSETCCRQIYGAHTYIAVSNFQKLCSDSIYAEDDYKRLIQGVHIYQREVTRIVENSDLFDGLRVHFQGSKLHALFYRPIDDATEIASRSLLLQLVVKDFVKSVFNPAFPHYDNFVVSGGSALGDVIGTRNGHRGDSELLFLGAPANYAAKIIGPYGSMRVDGTIYSALPSYLKSLCFDAGNDVYRIEPPPTQELAEILQAFGIDWDPDESADRVRADKASFPLKDIGYSEADVLIELDKLSIHHNKRVLGASLFADIAGFTRYIDAAQTDADQETALRVLHAVRKEMAAVIKRDFGGLRIQYQGDRVQALFHLPKGDEKKIAAKAVEAAIGLQSSMECAIKEILPESKELKLAVGVDLGVTLVSKLGTRGQRDRICLGEQVERAASCEERSAGGQIGISKRVYNALPDRLQTNFVFDETANCYVAEGLTAEKAERTAQAAMYAGGAPVFLRTGVSGVQVSHEEARGARAVSPSRSWAQ